MVILKFSIFLITLGFVGPSANAGKSRTIEIANYLSSCVRIESLQSFDFEKMVLLRIRADVKQPISECGCKSALGAFNVEVNHGGYRSILLEGKISFLTSEEKVLPLATEASLIGKRKMRISYSCAQPD